MVLRYPSQWRARRRSGEMMSSDCPTASSSAYPKMRSAPGFQMRMMPSLSEAITASADAARMASATMRAKGICGVSSKWAPLRCGAARWQSGGLPGIVDQRVGGTEELEPDPLGRHALAQQPVHEGAEEGLGAAQIVGGCLMRRLRDQPFRGDQA